MFNFQLLNGDLETVFGKVNTLVLTESTAKKYFGDTDPVGQLIILSSGVESQSTYEVTGVVSDPPTNSYIDFEILLSMKGFPIERLYWSWVWTQLETYVRLAPTANVSTVKEKFSKLPSQYADETLRRTMNTTFEEYIKSGKKWELFLQPMSGIHLPDAVVYNRIGDSGNIKVIYSFIGAAIFIVILSCINFMNLSTAQFTRRVKEASIQKVLGLSKENLSIGFFIEALLFCIVATVSAVALTQLLLPAFNFITERSLSLNLFSDPALIIGIIGLIVLMTLFSSSYPAFFLSSFKPAEAIKGKIRVGSQSKRFRNALVAFQFSLSIVLLICTGVVFQQLNYMSSKDIGFDRENLLVLNHVEMVGNEESFKNDLIAVVGVAEATYCRSLPPRVWGGDSFSAEGMNGKTFPLNYTAADEQFLPTLRIQLKFGRNFMEDAPGDANRVILNEAAVERIGWTLDETVIGKKLEYYETRYEIIGVVSDFNYWSLVSPIEPLGIFHKGVENINPGNRAYVALRMIPQQGKAWDKTIASLKSIFKNHAGDAPFDYEFVDHAFAAAFSSQNQFGKILTVMASLAIVIACLGLLGMIVYALEQRTKEIGIRKIAGASVLNILTLISKGYARIVVVAFFIGAPAAYWLMNQWLRDFPDRIIPSPTLFIAVGIGTLALSILITSYHTIRAATRNPVEILRDE
jgi:putative ABC transport system permease protein